MNDFIRTLKQRAGIDDNPDQEGLDLFAKLIVHECADLCHTRKLTPSTFTGDELLELFGVEE